MVRCPLIEPFTKTAPSIVGKRNYGEMIAANSEICPICGGKHK